METAWRRQLTYSARSGDFAQRRLSRTLRCKTLRLLVLFRAFRYTKGILHIRLFWGKLAFLKILGMKKIFTLVLLGLLSQFAIGQEVLINEKFSTNVFFPYRTENSWIKFTPRSIYELPCFWEYRPTAASQAFEFLPPDPRELFRQK